VEESINEIATALSLAQGEINNAEKTSENPFFKSKYADLAVVLNCVRPVFAKYGLSIVQIPSFTDGKVTVQTIIMHKSGQKIEGSLALPVAKQDAQGVGSAITYARRYAIAAMAGIAQEDDDAQEAVKPVKKDIKPEPAKVTKPKAEPVESESVSTKSSIAPLITPAELSRLFAMLATIASNHKLDVGEFTVKQYLYNAFNVASCKDIPSERVNKYFAYAQSEAGEKQIADDLRVRLMLAMEGAASDPTPQPEGQE
jgi:hypothetical protein